MKIIFMGTPEFSVPTLKTLIHSDHQVIGVITQPDKPKGRGNKVVPTPVKALALEHNIPVFQPKKVREAEFIQELVSMQPDVIVVIAFGQILPKALLDIPKYGCINIHASLLPKYRGAAPIQWSVINGEAETGLTTMYMDVGLDTGDMLLKEKLELRPEETGGSLHDRLSEMGGALILETLDQIESGTIQRIPQEDVLSSYAPMLSKDLGHIDWGKSAVEIERLIRGLNPWPSAYTFFDDKILKIWHAEIVPCNDQYSEPGTVCEVIKNVGFVIKCQDQGILIKELQLQGKNKMDAGSFLRGNTMTIGYKF